MCRGTASDRTVGGGIKIRGVRGGAVSDSAGGGSVLSGVAALDSTAC
jgi:hypothetical protein